MRRGVGETESAVADEKRLIITQEKASIDCPDCPAYIQSPDLPESIERPSLLTSFTFDQILNVAGESGSTIAETFVASSIILRNVLHGVEPTRIPEKRKSPMPLLLKKECAQVLIPFRAFSPV